MPTTQPLDIKVIYTAKPGGRPRRAMRPAERPERRSTERPAKNPSKSIAMGRANGPWLALGFANLLVAGACYYATWWKVDPFLYMTTMMRAPVSNVSVEAAASLLGLGAESSTPEQRRKAVNELAKNPPAPNKRTYAFAGAVYGWLTLSTFSYIILAMAAGGSLTGAGAGIGRRKGVILLGGCILGMAYAAYDILSRFGWQYRPDHLRGYMGGLLGIGLFLGLAFGGRPRKLIRVAAGTLILSAVGSVAGIWLLKWCDALEKPEYASPVFLIMVFAIHSIYGWLLIPLSSRVGRT